MFETVTRITAIKDKFSRNIMQRPFRSQLNKPYFIIKILWFPSKSMIITALLALKQKNITRRLVKGTLLESNLRLRDEVQNIQIRMEKFLMHKADPDRIGGI